MTTAPSPIILLANASSGAVERSAAIPVIGLEMITVLVGSFSTFEPCALSEAGFESVAEAAFSFFASAVPAILFSAASSSKCSSVTLAR